MLLFSDLLIWLNLYDDQIACQCWCRQSANTQHTKPKSGASNLHGAGASNLQDNNSHGTIIARDNYELTRNLPKCVGVERLCEGANFQIPFNADEINLIYQFGEQSKAETCASLSAVLPQIKDSDTKQIVSTTLKKLNVLSEKTCAELTATTKRRKLTERDHSIKARLAKAKEQAKQPTVAERKQHRTNSKGKQFGEMSRGK